jgi:hypothetical protein
MKLDAESLVVESFDVGQNVPMYAGEPAVDQGAERSQYCSLVNTCATCWTDCPCA